MGTIDTHRPNGAAIQLELSFFDPLRHVPNPDRSRPRRDVKERSLGDQVHAHPVARQCTNVRSKAVDLVNSPDGVSHRAKKKVPRVWGKKNAACRYITLEGCERTQSRHAVMERHRHHDSEAYAQTANQDISPSSAHLLRCITVFQC